LGGAYYVLVHSNTV